jgi:hypothetical protein
MWGNIRPESGPEPGLLVHHGFSGPRGVWLGPPDRRRDEDLVGQRTAGLWHVWPEGLPEGTRCPTVNAGLDGLPVATGVGEIPPWDSRTSLIPHRFDAHPGMALRRTAGIVLHGS